MESVIAYRIVTVAGDDRVSFLQGQLTQDVRRLEAGTGLPAAWCNAKGRVVVSGTLLGYEDRVGFAVPADAAETVVRRLGMYRLRARVDIALAGDDWLATAVEGRLRSASGIVVVAYADGWSELFGPREIVRKSLGERPALDDVEWRRRRIAAGLADIGVDASEHYTPHMLNLDRVGAVSYSKGCYTGQEVVARTEHLGSVKRRLARFRVTGHEPRAGDRLHEDGNEIGDVVTAAGSDILAMVPVERHGESFDINGGRADPLPLPWDAD